MTDSSVNNITITPESNPSFGRIWKISATQRLERPLEDVFPFFADAYNLEKLTPAFLNFKVLTPKPIQMSSGCEIKYTLKIHNIPIKWKTTILDWDPPHQFVDNQDSGPYSLWHHTHSFESINNGDATLCKDTVLYKPKGWILAPLINKYFVQRDVTNIFNYRFKKLEEIFPKVGSSSD